jgi:hypothetical protein
MGGYAITQTTRDMFDGIRPPRVNMTNAGAKGGGEGNCPPV